MRSLGIATAHAPPQRTALGELPTRLGVDLAEHDGVVGIAHHVAFAVLEEERGVDALLLQPDGLAPGPRRVGSSNYEIATISYVCSDHIVGAVVVAQRGRIDAQPRTGTLERQLRVACEHVADLPPMHQVGAMEDGHAGEILERGVHQIVVAAHATDAGVGVESADDGIAIHLRPETQGEGQEKERKDDSLHEIGCD